MLGRRLVGIGTMGWVACVVAAVAWAGCGGSTEEAGAPQGTGGTADNDASTGGTGGTGGTTQTGGSGGIAGTGGTSVEPDGSPPDVATDGSQPDAAPDASCLVYNQACDPGGNDCCAPLACVQGSNGARCRLEPSDAGLDGAACMPPQQVCTQTPCCPGLECVSQGPTEICRMPFDGGFPEGGFPEGGFPEGGTCHDLFEACGPGHGPCCQGLECKTDPPQYPDRQCLPPQPPDPADCPAQEPTPGDACTEVGMQCSYGMMTVCMCYLSGWQCAY